MALHKYFKPLAKPLLPTKVLQLTEKELDKVNAKVEAIIAKRSIIVIPQNREHVSVGTLLRVRVRVRVRVMQYFSKWLCTELPKATARRFKKKYLKKISKKVATSKLPGKSLRIHPLTHHQLKIKGDHCC